MSCVLGAVPVKRRGAERTRPKLERVPKRLGLGQEVLPSRFLWRPEVPGLVQAPHIPLPSGGAEEAADAAVGHVYE